MITGARYRDVALDDGLYIQALVAINQLGYSAEYFITTPQNAGPNPDSSTPSAMHRKPHEKVKVNWVAISSSREVH
jgi:hypothetical protein